MKKTEKILFILISLLAITGWIRGYVFSATITQTGLSDTIGTLRTNTNANDVALNEQLTSTTSSDPGHVHTASGVSGTISVAKGGSGTSTFVKGVLTASGTEAFGIVAPGTSGNFLKSDGTSWVSSSSVSGSQLTSSYTAIENITALDAVYVVGGEMNIAATGTTANFPVATIASSTCDLAGYAQSFSSQATTTLSGVLLRLLKAGSPTGNVIIELRSSNDNTSSSIPTATVLASSTLDASTLTTTMAEYRLSFNKTYQVNGSTTFWIVATSSVAISDVNYVALGTSNATTSYTRGHSAGSGGGNTWSRVGLTNCVQTYFEIVPKGTEIGRTNALTNFFSDPFIGFATAAINQSSSGNVATDGRVTGFTNLRVGARHYLTNVTGSIGVASGTIYRTVGIADSSSSLIITNTW